MFLLIMFLFCSCYQANSDEIPMVLWNIKGNVMNIKSMPRFHGNDRWAISTLKSALKDGSHILMFVLNNLSLEDFSVGTNLENNTILYLQSFLDTWPYVFISSVNDPFNILQEMYCDVKEIEVNKYINNNSIHFIALTLAQYCIVIVHVDGITGFKLQEIEELFLLSLKTFNFNIIGIFSGKSSPWTRKNHESYQVGSDDHPLIFRKLLQAANASIPTKDIINYNDCILLYSSNISIIAKKIYDGTINLVSPDTSGSICTEKSSKLLLTYKPTINPIQQVIIKFSFKNRSLSWDAHTTLNITTSNASYTYLFTSSNADIKAPIGRSFYCGGIFMRSVKQKNKVKLFFSNLYIQPFGVKDKTFSTPYKCIPSSNLLTIEIFEGMIISLVYASILIWGISHLLSIQTMERFDDPRDRTISTVITTPI